MAMGISADPTGSSSMTTVAVAPAPVPLRRKRTPSTQGPVGAGRYAIGGR